MIPLHLSKIEIDHETAHLAGLRDAYAWHQKTWECFPGREKADRDFLTRVDETPEGFRLLLQSSVPPSRPDWCPEPGWNTKSIPESFFLHPAYRFSLLANPTKKVRSNAEGERLKNSRRIPLTSRDELLDWLSRHAEAGGFQVESSAVQTLPKPRIRFIKRGKAGTLAATEYLGTLTVSDQEQFRKTVSTGIGPAKAFGFGMLCLSPLS